MEDGFYHSSPKVPQRKSKQCYAHISPEKLTFSGNFTTHHKLFDIAATVKRASMRRDILNTVIKRTESKLLEESDEVPIKLVDENPMYEDPRDVIGEKPPKPPRKRTVQAIAVTSPRPSRESKMMLKDQKKKLSKKYEGLLTTLISRCEENVVVISEKDAYILKLKDKLKTVLDYNKLFAEENDQLKSEHATIVQYVDECKTALREERERNCELDARCKELGDRVKQSDVPEREHHHQPSLSAIPLVEVCMSCSSRQILLHQAREQTARLQRDMVALKDVLYRLNVQLSRYQEKLRTNIHNLATDKDKLDKLDKFDLDSLITTSLGNKGPEAGNTDDGHNGTTNEPQTARVVDLSGLLSAQALAPLFDAYQENLQEKDSLILDYEKQFENINKKSKQIVAENKTLLEKVASLEGEILQVRQSYKKLVVEKETSDIERATLVERAERAESKLKEVYELYEGKISRHKRRKKDGNYSAGQSETRRTLSSFRRKSSGTSIVCKEMALHLCTELEVDLQPHNSDGLPVYIKVLTSLHFLADGNYQHGTGQDHGLCIAQVSNYLTQFTDAVNRRTLDMDQDTATDSNGVIATQQLPANGLFIKNGPGKEARHMAAMMRDYETVHREYFALKSALETSEGKMAQLDVLRARTVPADLHERRLEHCKRLLEELKHQYSMENERKTEQIGKLQQQLHGADERCSNASRDLDVAKGELAAALKNVRLYRKAAVIFRQRMRAAAARATRVRRSLRAQNQEPFKAALETMDRIKREIKEVKSRAHSSLEELERRILDQERRAAAAQDEYRRELERANLALEHKEGIIRSLIDKVADVEEVRLSQTNAHRLQGILTDSSPDRSGSLDKHPDKHRTPDKPEKTGVKLVPGPGGYFQDDRDRKKKGKG